MIVLSREDGSVLALNSALVASVTGHPPATVVELAGGARYLVAEPLEEIVALIHRDRAHDLGQAAALAALVRGDDDGWRDDPPVDGVVIPFRQP